MTPVKVDQSANWGWRTGVTILITMLITVIGAYYTLGECIPPPSDYIDPVELQEALDKVECEWPKDKPWIEKEITSIQSSQVDVAREVKQLQLENATQYATIMGELKAIRGSISKEK